MLYSHTFSKKILLLATIIICIHSIAEEKNRTLCILYYTHATTPKTENDLAIELSNQIKYSNSRDTDIENSYDCNSNLIENLSNELAQRNIPYTIQQHNIVQQENSATYIPTHVCYTAKDQKQCIDYKITLTQSIHNELSLDANIYNIDRDLGNISSLHNIKRTRRLKSKQAHYIDDSNIGILITHDFK